MRKHLVSIFVIVLALGALAYAYFGDRGKVSDLERERRAHLLFPAFRRDELQSLALDHGAEKIRFEAGNDDAGDRVWKMTAPAGDKGDTVAIDRLLSALEYASFERKVPEGGSGFENPRVRGRLSMDKVVYDFEVGGDATPPEGAAYFRLQGEGVFVIRKDLVTELMKSADAFRDRSVVPYLSIDLARFEIAGKESWAIQRLDDISFIIVSSGKFQGVRASRTGLDKVWGGLAEMRAEAFPSQNEAAQALASPLLTMTMTPKDAATPHAVLALGGACSTSAPDDIVLERQQPTHLVACVPKGALTGISTPLEDLADKHLFVAIPEEVEEISLENVADKTKIELARKGEGWHERAPVDHDLSRDEAEMATAFVKSITSSEGEILDPKPPPFAATFRVKITRAESHVLETIDLFNATAHRISDDAVLSLSPLVFRRLQPRVSALRASTIWPSSFEGTRVDQLADDCAVAKQVIARDASGKFHFQNLASLPVDSANVIALAEAVERARATSWAADADDGAFGTKNGCSVSITTHGDAGDRGGKIWFGGDASNDEVFARINDDPAVFTVSRAIFDLAKTLLVDRSIFFLDADAIDSVELSHAGKALHFSLRPGDDDAGLEAMAAAAAVGELQADAALHLGPPKSEEGFATPALDVKAHAIEDGGARSLHYTVGASALRNGQKIFYGRVEGIDVSFALPEARVRPLLDAVGNHGP